MEENNVIYSIIALSLLPVAVLLFYIYHKDRYAPEPISQLLKAFFLGILAVPLSLLLSVPFEILGLYTSYPTTITGSIAQAFWGAAIPEEAMKLYILWLVLRKNKYFDEKMDGIVYAVFVSMGFAAIENFLYLFEHEETFVTTGIMRGIFSVPGHFCFAILMGYYYSLTKFYSKNKNINKVLVLIAPIMVHGIYDSILFVSEADPYISGVCTIAFLVFCHHLWKFGSRRIEEHLKRDLYNN